MTIVDVGLTRAQLSGARRATRALFCALGFLSGGWAVHVPSAKQHYQLGPAALSLALLAAALGAVLALGRAGALVQRHGPRRVAVGAMVLLAAAYGAVLLPPLAVPVGAAAGPLRTGLLWALMLLSGVAAALFDVAINTEGSALERLGGRPVMSGFHGFWSIGGLAGAGLCSLLLKTGLSPSWQLPLMAAGALGLVLAARRAMLPETPGGHEALTAASAAAAAPAAPAAAATVTPSAEPDPVPEPPAAAPTASPWRRPMLWLLGGLGISAMLAEGVVYDWIVLWLQQDVGMAPALAAWGYGGFAAAMAVTRLLGDRIRAHLSPRQLLGLGGLLTGSGMALALLTRTPAVALPALVLAGVGVAQVVPVILALASRQRGLAPAAAIATVSALGYFAFVGGPPIVGLLAERHSLSGALWVAVVAAALLALGSRLLPRG